MHSSHSRLAGTIIVGLLIASACTSAAEPDVTPTPSITVTAAAASPTEAATPASAGPSATPRPTQETTTVLEPPKPTEVTFHEETRPIGDGQFGEVTQTVTWGAPRSQDVEFGSTA